MKRFFITCALISSGVTSMETEAAGSTKKALDLFYTIQEERTIMGRSIQST